MRIGLYELCGPYLNLLLELAFSDTAAAGEGEAPVPQSAALERADGGFPATAGRGQQSSSSPLGSTDATRAGSGRDSSSRPPTWYPWTPQWRLSPLTNSPLGPLTAAAAGAWCASWQPGKGVGPQLFLWCLAGVQWLVSQSFLSARQPLSWSFGQRQQDFVVCAHWHFWAAGFFSNKSWTHVAKTEPGISPPCHSLGLEIPNQAVSFLSTFQGILCLFYNVQGFQLYLEWRIRKKYLCSILPEAAARILIF